MDVPRDYHTKRSKSDRERQIYDITYMWNLKKMIQMNLQSRNRLTDIENKLMVNKRERWGGGGIN